MNVSNVSASLRMYLILTVILGVIYPALVTGFAKVAFPRTSGGDLVERGGRVVGARPIGQKFARPENLWPRPSAVDFNPLASGGSNLGPTSTTLRTRVTSFGAEVPNESVFTSASGVDPHLTLAAAVAQAARIASARGVPESEVVTRLRAEVEPTWFGLYGEPVINVLDFNLSWDR